MRLVGYVVRMDLVYPPVIAVAKTIFAIQGLRFRITGEENIPADGGVVLVINHTGYMDYMFAGLPFERRGRYVRFMAKDAIFQHPIGGPLLRSMNHICVDREAGAASFRAALGALKSGEVVGIFAEATISRSFELKRFKTGAVRMAQASGAPIVPLVIWGSQRIWTKGKPRRLGRTHTPVAIRVGEPYHVPKGADADAATAELKSRMQAMLDLEQADYPQLTGDELQFLPKRLGGTAPTLEEATALDEAEAAARRRAKGLDGGEPDDA